MEIHKLGLSFDFSGNEKQENNSMSKFPEWSVMFHSLWPHGLARLLLSMKFSGQEYWSGLLFSTPGNLPEPGMEPVAPVSHGLLGSFYTIVPSEKPSNFLKILQSTRQPCFLGPLPPGGVFFRLVGWKMRAQGPGLPTYLEHYCHHEETVSRHQKPLEFSSFEAKSCRRAHRWGLGKGLDPSWASLPSSLWPYRILEHWWNPGVQYGEWGTRTEPAAAWSRPESQG